MILEELSKEHFDKDYYDRVKSNPDKEETKLHIQLDTGLANELSEVIAVYRALNIEKHKITKSELISILLSEFFKELEEDENKIYDITVLLNQYRTKQGA